MSRHVCMYACMKCSICCNVGMRCQDSQIDIFSAEKHCIVNGDFCYFHMDTCSKPVLFFPHASHVRA